MKSRVYLTYAYGLAFSLIMVSALLSGCQALGVPQAETFNQRVAAGYVAITGVTDSALVLGQASKISLQDAQNIHDQAKTLKGGLDITVSLHATQPGASEDRLSAVLVALTALDQYLKTRGTP